MKKAWRIIWPNLQGVLIALVLSLLIRNYRIWGVRVTASLGTRPRAGIPD